MALPRSKPNGSRDAYEDRRASLREGMRQLDAGERIPLADIKAWVESWDTADELPKPKAPSRRRGLKQ